MRRLYVPNRARLLTAGLATALAGVVGVAPLPTTAVSAATSSAPAPAAPVAAGAPIVVGNADDDEFSGAIDLLLPGAVAGFPSSVDEDDGMAVGNVTGDGLDEVVVVDDVTQTLDVHSTVPGADTLGKVLFSWESRFNAEEDAVAVGNVTADADSEILVADEEHGQLTIYDQDGKILGAIVEDLGFDSDDRMVTGNVVGDDLEEILIVNSEALGRVDVYNAKGVQVDTVTTGFDGNSDDVATGNTRGDPHDEVVVARDEFNAVTSFDVAGDDQATLSNTGYDSDDRIDVGPVNVTGTDEIVIANTEQSGRLDIFDFEGDNTTRDSGYDGDDRFAVGTFGSGDLDNDGIPDRVELGGIRGADGDIVDGWDLDALGASPCRPDVLVEADYMDASDAATDKHNHRPDQSAIDDVVAAFAGAPVEPVVEDCPYPGEEAGSGIGLHIVVGNAIEHQDELAGKAGFEAVKAADGNFDDALDPYVHYALFAHEFTGDNDTVAGLADFTSDLQDLAIVLGDGDGHVGSPDLQATTFMHELGHTLGLEHGGRDDTNQKPNYLSVMNYSFAAEGAPKFGVINANGERVRDFSRAKLDTLVKTELREPVGIGKTDFQTLWYDESGTEHVEVANGPLDWDFDGDPTETVSVDVNRDLCVVEDPLDDDKVLSTSPTGDDLEVTDGASKGINGGPDMVCNTAAQGSDLQVTALGEGTVLTGFNDWANLDLRHGTLGGSTALRPPAEMTEAELAEITAAWDQGLFPDVAVLLDAPRPGFRAASLGVATDDEHVYALHSYRTVTDPATTDRPGSLIVLDRKTLAVEDRIPVGFGPRSIAVDPVRRVAYVANAGDGDQDNFDLSVVDLVARQVVDEIEIGQGPVDVAVNVGLNRVYVSNPFGQRIEVIDGATRTKLDPIPIGPGAVGLAVDEEKDAVHVALTKRGGGQPEIAALGTVVDDGVTRPRVLAPVSFGDPSIQPVDVAVDPVSNQVFVAGLGASTGAAPSVTVLDRDTRQIVTQIPARGPVRALAVHPEQRVVIAVGDRGVELIDTSRLAVVRHIDAGLPFSVAPATGSGRQFYVGDFLTGELTRRSYSSGEPR
jgi:DNA-binding beta-propeller fold protein YncE